ncbi:MAG: 2,3-bisphosphoglycerate-independent phosphoglycerate mutase [Firmicutes bacterium]|nr:2,3-bisphosphoglycerate-independent phosphoglycerate mutase [Bacillota bacterium]
MKKPFMLMILDGFGLKDKDYGNAIKAANTPNLDHIFNTYPNTQLAASGLSVGLPDGQMGNSEVGHLNIGAGRVVYQELTRITKAIEDGIFAGNAPILNAINHAKETGGSLHVMGLLSDGGVHSHLDHIKATLALAEANGMEKIYLHCFMDGRDVPPTSGIDYVKDVESFMEGKKMSIGIVSGRYYAMDRDKRWDRVKLAYDALTLGEGRKAATGSAAVEFAYSNNETDEFIIPTICNEEATVKDGDSIIFCNFRPDRAREITRAFVDDNFDGFERTSKILNLNYVCMTQYDATMPNVEVAFPPASINNTLGEHLASLGKTQLRIAETEKYAHVTFFFNGGVEQPNTLEDRLLVPSPEVATYDLQPEMSAYTVAEKVVEEIKADKYDCIILNFANPDMVGHTGVFEAAVKAIEAVDECVGKVVEAMLDVDGQILITADHGNADDMLDDAGNVVTAHSTNPVPLVHIAKNPSQLAEGGKLCDIAPTMLTLMGLPIPAEMTGVSLV